MQIEFTKSQVDLVARLVKSQMCAQHNWIACAVENGVQDYGQSGLTGFAYAQKLVKELRDTEEVMRVIRIVYQQATGEHLP